MKKLRFLGALVLLCVVSALFTSCYSVSNTGWTYTDFGDLAGTEPITTHDGSVILTLVSGEVVMPVTDAPAGTPISVRDNRGWDLTFSDEFEGTQLDTEKWLVVQAEDDHRYHQDNVYLRDGKLVLAVNNVETELKAARIDTRDTFSQRYGVFETRAKIDQVEDTIFALWLSNYPGVNQVGNDGQDGAEIDIIETGYQSNSVIHTLHWDGYGRHHQSHSTGKFDIPIDMHQGFHVYGLEWYRDRLYLFVDGILTAEYAAEGIPWVEEFVILSSERMAHWEGDIKNATLPVEFEVDWVRVYQQWK